MELIINIAHTKYMCTKGYQEQARNLSVRTNRGSHYEFEAVNTFSYLGVRISNVSNKNVEI